jgi:hypothetical protein
MAPFAIYLFVSDLDAGATLQQVSRDESGGDRQAIGD